MKTKGQNIPPELLAGFRDLISPGQPTPDGAQSQRTRRKAKKPRTPRRQTTLDRNLSEVIEAMLAAIDITPALASYKATKRLAMAEARRGIFRPQWWIECPKIATAYAYSQPTSVPRDDQSGYLFPDPDYKPTRPTYPMGTLGDGPASYSGALIGDRFTDINHTWQADTFQLDPDVTPPHGLPLVSVVAGDVTAHATTRGSKPMFSLIGAMNTGDEANHAAMITTPPTPQDHERYWRFRRPGGGPPYYNATAKTGAVWPEIIGTPTESGDPPSLAVVKAAPRPMYGIGYNNNASVTTSATFETRLYQPAGRPKAQTGIIIREATGYVSFFDVETGELKRSRAARYTNWVSVVTGAALVGLTTPALAFAGLNLGTRRTLAPPPPFVTMLNQWGRSKAGWMFQYADPGNPYAPKYIEFDTRGKPLRVVDVFETNGHGYAAFSTTPASPAGLYVQSVATTVLLFMTQTGAFAYERLNVAPLRVIGTNRAGIWLGPATAATHFMPWAPINGGHYYDYQAPPYPHSPQPINWQGDPPVTGLIVSNGYYAYDAAGNASIYTHTGTSTPAEKIPTGAIFMSAGWQ